MIVATARSHGRGWIAAGALLGAVLPTAVVAQNRPHFDVPEVVLPPTDHFEALYDFDLDGHTDALSIWWTSSSSIAFRGYRNDGAGGFALAWTVTQRPLQPQPDPLTFARTGDFDGDGRTDFVSANKWAVWYFLTGPGNGQPTQPWTYLLNGDVRDLAVADFDADGIDDVAVLHANGVAVLRSSAGAAPTSIATAAFAARTDDRIVACDLDHDGGVDVAVQDNALAAARLLHFGGGTLAGPTVTYGFMPETHLTAGDIDGDGDDDLVAFGGASFVVLRHGSANTFAVEPAVVGGPASDLLDVDGDGDLDGACCGGGGFAGYLPTVAIATMRICTNDGTGRFSVANQVTNRWARELCGGADLDGDGTVDLVAGRAVLFGGPVPFAQKLPTARPGARVGARALDLDRDGDLDLVCGLGPIGRNLGDATTANWTIAVPAPPGSTFLGPGYFGDFDGDGDLDLVVQQYFGPTFASMRLLRNCGNGSYFDGGDAGPSGVQFNSFRNGQLIGAFDQSGCLVGDVDDDGDLDLVCRAGGNSTWASTVYLNNGNGRFVPGISYDPQRIEAIVDFDRDGTTDLLVAWDSGAAVLMLCRGLGGGVFAPVVIDPSLTGRLNYTPQNQNTIVDIDGDGDVDVLAPQYGGYQTQLFLNDGAGNLGAPIVVEPVLYHATSSIPYHALAVDVDRDGRLDIVTGPTGDGFASVRIYRQIAPGSFALSQTQVADFAWAGDLDGDGDPELVTADDRIAWGRTFEAASAGSLRQFGTGSATSPNAGIVLGEVGPFRVPGSGRIVARGGFGGAFGFLGIGFRQVDLPLFGGTLYVDPVLLLTVTMNGDFGVAGAGTLDLPWSLPPALAGVTFVHQLALLDAGAPGGIALSHGMSVAVGR